MAGASTGISIEFDDAELQAALKKLAAKIGDLTPFFRDIGEELLNSTRERFRAQRSPAGVPWEALSPAYAQRKRKNRDKILTLDGRLRGTLNYRAGPDELRIGTPLIYGATHQFGRPEKNIPARPFLGLSDADRAAIQAALADWLQN
ncbi:MAG: phage virion morphogenesis protein [Candidatus Competibacteraceae bacterium]